MNSAQHPEESVQQRLGMLVSLSKRHNKLSPTILAFTSDQQILDLLRDWGTIWRVEARNNFVSCLNRLENKKSGVVVLDDDKILKPDLGWSLNKIQQLMPWAFIIYVASQHSPEIEKTAQGYQQQKRKYPQKDHFYPLEGLWIKLIVGLTKPHVLRDRPIVNLMDLGVELLRACGY